MGDPLLARSRQEVPRGLQIIFFGYWTSSFSRLPYPPDLAATSGIHLRRSSLALVPESKPKAKVLGACLRPLVMNVATRRKGQASTQQ
jgi:hypothetical protein